MAKGVEDTAFYRYGRLLALNDVGGDPGRFGISVDAFHRANLSARALPAQPARHADARHQALGRRARADRRAGRHGRGVGGARAALAGGDARRCGAGHGRALLHLPDAGGGVADRGRAARGVRREGAARGQAQHELDRARHGVRGPREGVLPRAVRAPPVPERLRAVRRRGRARRRPRRARRSCCSSSPSPACPTSTRATSCSRSRSSTPTTAAAVDWARRRELLAEVRRGAAPTDETRKLWLIVRALTLRAHRPDAFAGGYTPLAAGRRRVAFLRGDTVLAAVALRGEPAGAVDVPAGTWRDALAGGERRIAGADARSPSCSASTGSRCSSASSSARRSAGTTRRIDAQSI